MTTLCIVEESGGGRSISIVKVRDRQLLAQAAIRAIFEAFERAEGEQDEALAVIHFEEAERLSRTLRRLLPELEREPVGHECVANVN
jgi:hypothetical protein